MHREKDEGHLHGRETEKCAPLRDLSSTAPATCVRCAIKGHSIAVQVHIESNVHCTSLCTVGVNVESCKPTHTTVSTYT